MLRAFGRERGDTRDRADSLVSKIDEDGGMLREARERERNARSDAIGGIIK